MSGEEGRIFGNIVDKAPDVVYFVDMQNTTNTAAALTALEAKAARSLSKYNAAGEPLYTWTGVVNGHKVQARISGWENERTAFEVDGSTEPLTLAQAAERVAA